MYNEMSVGSITTVNNNSKAEPTKRIQLPGGTSYYKWAISSLHECIYCEKLT